MKLITTSLLFAILIFSQAVSADECKIDESFNNIMDCIVSEGARDDDMSDEDANPRFTVTSEENVTPKENKEVDSASTAKPKKAASL